MNGLLNHFITELLLLSKALYRLAVISPFHPPFAEIDSSYFDLASDAADADVDADVDGGATVPHCWTSPSFSPAPPCPAINY